jgi:predicted nucleotidyltransferase
MVSLVEQNLDRIVSLCHKYGVERLDLFGSAVRNDFDPTHSDLDFVVNFSNFTINNAADRFLGLMIDLEDLFGRKVDLVSYRAIKNPFFKTVVDSTSVNLYAA